MSRIQNIEDALQAIADDDRERRELVDENAKLRKALEVADKALGFVRNRLDLASAAKNLPFAIERVNEAQADIQQARTEIQDILKQVKTHEG